MAGERSKAQARVQVETDTVIVTEWRFASGAETGWHRHGYDYVVVPMTSGTLTLETAEGVKHAELSAGEAYARLAGVEHNVVYEGPGEFVFVEVELKDRAG